MNAFWHACRRGRIPAHTIGRACAQIHVSDDFLFERIRALAAAGAVEIVTDGGLTAIW